MAEQIAERLISLIRSELLAHGMPSESATELSAHVVVNVCKDMGGGRVYLPRRLPWSTRAMRDRAICATFDGTNLADVCQRFGVSRSTVYRACRKR